MTKVDYLELRRQLCHSIKAEGKVESNNALLKRLSNILPRMGMDDLFMELGKLLTSMTD